MAVDPITQGMRRGAAVFGFFAAMNRNRKANKARRRKRKGKELTPEQERLIVELGEVEVSSMQGLKTYTGILVALIGVVLGWMGLGDAESAELSAKIVASLDQVITIGGLLFAAYGRAKAKPAG